MVYTLHTFAIEIKWTKVMLNVCVVNMNPRFFSSIEICLLLLFRWEENHSFPFFYNDHRFVFDFVCVWKISLNLLNDVWIVHICCKRISILIKISDLRHFVKKNRKLEWKWPTYKTKSYITYKNTHTIVIDLIQQNESIASRRLISWNMEPHLWSL